MAAEHATSWLDKSDFYALGALDGAELGIFEAHIGAGCAACENRLRETREALLLLHRPESPAAPPAENKERLMRRIAADKVVALPAAPRPRRRWQIIAGTVAAGIAGAVITGVIYTKRYEPRHTVYSAVIDLLRDPSTRDLPLYGTGPTPGARGRFLWNESGEGHIFVSGLASAPEGRMYAVWTIAQSSAPRYVGSVATDAAGNGGLHINTEAGKPVETFAVTLEPLGSTAAPTGPMVLSSKSPAA